MQAVLRVALSAVLLAAVAPALAQPVALKPDAIKWSDMKGMPGWKHAVGTGDELDKSKGRVLGVGSFYMLPANTTHYASSGAKGVTLQVHGVGPSGMTTVEPAKK
jgi:hypothetical protein